MLSGKNKSILYESIILFGDSEQGIRNGKSKVLILYEQINCPAVEGSSDTVGKYWDARRIFFFLGFI
jgi:hypothetical protein